MHVWEINWRLIDIERIEGSGVDKCFSALIRGRLSCYESWSEHALPQGRPIRMQGARVQGYVCAAGRCTVRGRCLPLTPAIGTHLRK